MASLLASAESMSVGVRTVGGRMLEYRTSLIAEDADSFAVHAPADLRERLHVGQVVFIKAALPNGFLLFETAVRAIVSAPVAHLDLDVPEAARVRRIPRRQHFRVSATLPVTFTFERPGARIPEQNAALSAMTFDISSGGVGILADRARDQVLPALHAAGDLEITLAPAGVEPRPPRPPVITCHGRVVRIEEIEETSRVLLGVDFRGIGEQQRMEVSRFVIAHQLALRRRGVVF
jgi:hypothetical protein